MADDSQTFKHPANGYRFNFGGVNTRDVPDALPQGKYAAAQNVRSTGASSIRTRPGYNSVYSAGNNAVIDIRGYTALSTDSLPRFLSRDGNGGIWLDTGVNVGNMAGNAGYGASMLPFRPAESSQTWMYVGTEGDYQKFSAPNASNNVTQYKVGIAEPQNQVEAAPQYMAFFSFTGNNGNWTPAGTAGNISTGNRVADVSGSCFPDPARVARYYIQVGNNANAVYQSAQHATIGNNSVVIQKVIPAIPANLAIQSIIYQTGSNGNCIITPSQSAIETIPGADPMAALTRGSIVLLGGAETALVLGTIRGPNGLFAFQTSTNNTWAANASIAGLPSIVVDGNGTTFSPGQNITEGYFQATVAFNNNNGLGSFSRNFSASPFASAFPGTSEFPQQEDHVHCSLNVSDPTQLIQILLMFNLDSANFNQNVLYYAIRPNDFAAVIGGNQTYLDASLQALEANQILQYSNSLNNAHSLSAQSINANNNPQLAAAVANANLTLAQLAAAETAAGQSQWVEIVVPLSALTRLGTDQTRTLVNCTGVQIQVNVSNNISFGFGGLWVGGGGQPDTGNNGAPYYYQCIPLSSVTGVRGNPTPVMRYGVDPKRQPVIVKTSALNNSYDPQIDTWEVFRYGGSITSSRFIGSVQTGTDFIDNVFDDAAIAGRPLDIDNTEPWPSIDVPWKQTTGSITAFGPILTVSGATLPATMNRWLPGTIFQVGGQDAFTLRSRPVVSGNNATFEFEECIGSGSQSSVFVLEPNVARQTLPYLWGPNEQGYFFGCGDPLRPGVIQWTKAYGPDAVPTAYDLDLCPPSEPLLGGEVISGISIVASSLRWWALYFQAGSTPLYNQVELPLGKRLAAPFGKCTDGKLIYFWATDCIAATAGQGAAESLTDADLFNLFPHGGLSGTNVVRGSVTFYAPDYSRAATFRMAIREGILYALYQDSTGTYRMLIGQLGNGNVAWSTDSYADTITTVYSIEQPKGTLELAPALYPAVIMGSNAGGVFKLVDGIGDNNNGIHCFVYPNEIVGDDLRSDDLWGDQYVDVLAPAGMNVTPVTQGNSVYNNTVVPANNSRQFLPVSLGGGQLLNFLGMQLSWTDFANNNQGIHTKLYAWQPSFVPKPETTQDRYGDWYDFGQASYVRGLIVHADTYGQNKHISIRNADNNSLVQFSGGPATGVINHNNEQEVAYWFTPFVAHMVRDEPQDLVPWRKFDIEWIKDAWPELTTLSSAWMNLGAEGAKYLRGAVIPMDTNGQAVELTFLSSDGGTQTVGPFTTTAAEKTSVGWAFTIPLIGHDFQLIPSGPIRVWYEEIRWDFQPWPELIDEATGWLPVLEGGGAAFLQGLVLPIETDGAVPALSLLTDTGAVIALTATVTPPANVKTGVPYSLATPTICHQVQILPTAPCRVWLGEIQWIAEPTPEQASTWTTQWTALGSKGYKHIPRIEASYSSTADVALTITSYDGTSPTVLALPGTGGATHKLLLTLTLNKGQLYKFSATSPSTFQIFAEDFLIWVFDWGRDAPARPYPVLGGAFGDKARI